MLTAHQASVYVGCSFNRKQTLGITRPSKRFRKNVTGHIQTHWVCKGRGDENINSNLETLVKKIVALKMKAQKRASTIKLILVPLPCIWRRLLSATAMPEIQHSALFTNDLHITCSRIGATETAQCLCITYTQCLSCCLSSGPKFGSQSTHEVHSKLPMSPVPEDSRQFTSLQSLTHEL